MFDFITITKALSDENRVRMLMALRERSLCVCQMTAFLDLAPSTTSKHLSILRQSRLIVSSKQGRWVYYRLADEHASSLVCEALHLMCDQLAHDPVMLADEARIEDILRAEAACGLNDTLDGSFHSPELHTFDTCELDEQESPA